MKLMTRKEAAESLGVALRTVDALTASGDLPVVRIGKAVRFRPSALELFCEANETRKNPRRLLRRGRTKASTSTDNR